MSGSRMVDIARAGAADRDALSEVLARAFQDDPVLGYVVPDAARRRERLPAVFAAFADVYLPHDESYLAADGAGGALWAPPGSEPLSGEPLEVFGERMSTILEEDAERAFRVDAVLGEHHPEEDCFYLQFVGVVPGHQGRGTGSRLLRAVLDRCDASATPAYLEATSADNRRLYERHGFESIRELTLPDGPPLWPMWREPAA